MAGIQNTATRIRFNADISKWKAGNLTDVIGGGPVQVPSGADLQFELAFSDGEFTDENLVDFSNIATVYTALQSPANAHNLVTYWSVAIAHDDIVPNGGENFSVANWNNGADEFAANTQQIVATVSSAQNALQPSGNLANYWLVVYAVTNDATPKQFPLCAFQVSIVDSGLPTGNPALPQPFKVGTKMPFVCADGLTRDVTLIAAPNGRWTLSVQQAGYNGPGQQTFSLYCADGQWRDLTVVQDDGAWTLDINQTGHS